MSTLSLVGLSQCVPEDSELFIKPTRRKRRGGAGCAAFTGRNLAGLWLQAAVAAPTLLLI